MPDWPEYPLGEVTFFQEGPGILAKDFKENGTPLVRLAGLGGYQVTLNKCNFVSDEKVSTKWKHFQLEIGDILVSTSASFGRPAVVGPEAEGAIFYTGIIRFRSSSERLDDGYLKLFLGSKKFELQAEAYASGSVIRHFGPSHLRQMTIQIPSRKFQRQIADLIGTLDDKIELNRRTNETLEAMARAIFKDWFVDFGPTRAKMAGRTPYLTPNLWALFPDRLDDEDKPVGWEHGNVGQCFDLTMGQSPPGNTYNDDGEGLPFFQGRTDFGFRYPDNRKFCAAPKRTAESDDTLVSVRAPVGDINMAWEKCCIGRGVAALRHSSGSRSFTYHSAWAIQKELNQYEHTGTVFGSINKTQFEALATIEPPSKVVVEFEAYVGQLDDRIRTNVSESRTLAQTRDLLLPRLMSGEIRLRDAGKAVEAVA